MKTIKLLVAAGLAGSFILASAGCANTKSSDNQPSETEAPLTLETVSETTEITEGTVASHQVMVEDLSKTSLTDEYSNTYTSAYPKLIVDGVEVTEINDEISSYIQQEVPLELRDGYIFGFETRYEWGVKDNIVSIRIHSSATDSDYFTDEVFNYDLDTLKALEDREVTKRLGITDEELFSKTAAFYRNYCDGIRDLDLDGSLASIDYDNITPFICDDGNPAVVGGVRYASDSQFGGSVCTVCFDLVTMQRT